MYCVQQARGGLSLVRSSHHSSLWAGEEGQLCGWAGIGQSGVSDEEEGKEQGQRRPEVNPSPPLRDELWQTGPDQPNQM